MIEDSKSPTILDIASGALFNSSRALIELGSAMTIHYFTGLASGEINGLGEVEKRGNDFIITKTFILEQKASGARVKIIPMALNRYVAQCEDPGKIKFEWHSHGSGSVFFSEHADIPTIRRWLGDFLISLVVNKRGDYLCRLELFKPFYLCLKIPLLVVIPLGIDQELLSHCRQEITAKVNIGKLAKIMRAPLKRDNRFSDWVPRRKLVLVPWKEVWQEEERQ